MPAHWWFPNFRHSESPGESYKCRFLDRTFYRFVSVISERGLESHVFNEFLGRRLMLRTSVTLTEHEGTGAVLSSLCITFFNFITTL